ncbi:hypothetical protein D3C84_706050 [compost metagenome]
MPRQADERWNLAQIVIHQGDIGGFNRGIGARCRHRKTDLGSRQCRGVVDTVPDHSDVVTLCIKGFDGLQLVARQQITPGFIDAHLRGNRLGGVDVIASEHQGLDAQIMQLLDRFAAGLLDRVGHGKQRQRARLIQEQDYRLALFFQGEQRFFQGWRTQAQLLDQSVVAQVIELTIDLAAHTTATQRFEVIHNQRRKLFIHSRIGDGQRYRVIRTPGKRRRNGRGHLVSVWGQ